MRREKQQTAPKSRLGNGFADMRVHSDDIKDFKVDSEPSFRMEAVSDGTHNKADIALEKLLEKNVMPARKNAGLKKQTSRRMR